MANNPASLFEIDLVCSQYMFPSTTLSVNITKLFCGQYDFIVATGGNIGVTIGGHIVNVNADRCEDSFYFYALKEPKMTSYTSGNR